MTIRQILLMDGTVINKCDGEITEFLVNGEMAHITWYRETTPDGVKLDINRNFVATVGWED